MGLHLPQPPPLDSDEEEEPEGASALSSAASIPMDEGEDPVLLSSSTVPKHTGNAHTALEPDHSYYYSFLVLLIKLPCNAHSQCNALYLCPLLKTTWSW